MNNGEFSVVKSRLPFVALGVDHAGEQENKLLKISGGLRGIANNENARNRFFINAPFVNIIKKGLKGSYDNIHHNLRPKIKKQEEKIRKIP